MSAYAVLDTAKFIRHDLRWRSCKTPRLGPRLLSVCLDPENKTHSDLRLLCASGLDVPVKHFLDDVGEQAGGDDDDDGEPGRATGQQLDKDKIHVLRVEEWPVEKGKKLYFVPHVASNLANLSMGNMALFKQTTTAVNKVMLILPQQLIRSL